METTPLDASPNEQILNGNRETLPIIITFPKCIMTFYSV